MTVGSLLHGKGDAVVTARPDQPVDEIVAILVEHRIGAVLIMDGDDIAGILSERDVVRCLGKRGDEVLHAPASDIMTAEVETVTPDESIPSALAHMTRRRIRHLPVLDQGRLAGIVSIGDLVKRRIEEAEAEAETLKDYIQHS
ncbi:MAG: CBS domain-containing protein [Pseudomonadota bacterium]